MPFKCRFCGMKVFWNTRIPSPKTGKPTLCTARGDEGLNIAHVYVVFKDIYTNYKEKRRKQD